MMNRIAVFPGTFDPLSLGHVDIVKRALHLFDAIYIAIGINMNKKPLFSLALRQKWLKTVFKDYPQIRIDTYHGLTVDYCKEKNAAYILRGLRNTMDFEYEKTLAQLNNKLNPFTETVFMMCHPEYNAINSSAIRDILINQGDASAFLPPEIAMDIQNNVSNQ